MQPGEPGLVPSVGRTQRTTLEPGDFLEGQSAPKPADDYFTGLAIQVGQEPGGEFGVDPVVGGGEPRVTGCGLDTGRPLLAALSAA